jgi:Sulfotransferase domain
MIPQVARAYVAALKTTIRALRWLHSSVGRAIQQIDHYRWARFEFVLRPSDIFIVSFPRSGTTWMQMIVYQICSGGDRSFEHISQVAPMFEQSLAHASVGNGAPRNLQRRLIKTHATYSKIPKGLCRYIYVLRNGEDVAWSLFHFRRTYGGESKTYAAFLDQFLKDQSREGSWHSHVSTWWNHRNTLNVLFVRYEDLVDDLAGSIKRIAEFCDITVDDANLPRILEACSFQYMKQHEEKFDPMALVLLEKYRQRSEFLRIGRSGTGREAMSEAHREIFRERFRDVASLG